MEKNRIGIYVTPETTDTLWDTKLGGRFIAAGGHGAATVAALFIRPLRNPDARLRVGSYSRSLRRGILNLSAQTCSSPFRLDGNIAIWDQV